MKTLLLASATALTLGMGAAFAASNTTALANTQSPTFNTPTSAGGDPAGNMGVAPAPGAPSTFAYFTPQGLVPRTVAPALPTPRPTPLGAEEAYSSDAAGGG